MAQIMDEGESKPRSMKPHLTLANLTSEQKTLFTEVKELDVTNRINMGDFDSVNLKDVRDLFRMLDMDGSGDLDFDEVKLFLHEIMDPPCPEAAVDELYLLAQEASGNRIGPEYFHSAITTGPLRRLLHDVQRQAAVQSIVAEATQAPITREFMLERFEWRVSRDESLRTLPFSLVYLCVFISLVICHLRIWERQQVERGLEGHISGWGFKYIGPYLEDHLPNLDQVYEWAQQSGLQVVFGYCSSTADKSVAAEFCEVAPRNILISDVMLRQERDDETRETWLLHSDVAKAHLALHPDEAYPAALLELANLRSTRWFDHLSNTFELHFLTYNEKAQFFAASEIVIRFDDYGFATHGAYTWAIPALAYDRLGVLIADFLYLVMLVIPIKGEIMEICTAVKFKGKQGFKDYWGFWNVVDWLMIFNGLLIIQIWLQIILAVDSPNIQGMLTGDDFILRKDVMALTLPAIDSLREDLGSVLVLYRVMHMVMAGNIIAIMLKFFKAFQANARLQVVTVTLIQAASDIFHFMVVFVAVFNGFVVTGHILLGGDMVHFNSFGASFNTAFLCLMGDFGWYSDLTMEVEPLASGLPYTVVSIWFWSFMIFALLILLNMLLAIIMVHYGAVTNQLNGMPDAPTLITQCYRYYTRAQIIKAGGFSPLDHFVQVLTDEKKGTHPDNLVTNDSMQEAFPDMKTEQVTFLMKWLQKDANAMSKIAGDDEALIRIKKCHSLMQTIAENLHAVALTVLRCDNRLNELAGPTGKGSRSSEILGLPPASSLAKLGNGQRAPQPPILSTEEPAAEPSSRMDPSSIAWQLDSQQRVIKELRELLAKQQRSSENVTRALGEYARGQANAQGMPLQAKGPSRSEPHVRNNWNPVIMPKCCGTDPT